jgi:exopolysaccharide biosynthesis polyprenyl glycosylphosphotransferase
MNAKHSSQSNHIPAMLGDAVIVVLAFVSAMLGRFLFDRQINPLPGARFGNWNSAPGAVCLLLFLSAYLWTAQQYGLYSSRSSASRFHQITKTCQACLNAFFVLSGGMFLVHAVALSREVLVFLTVLASIALCGYRYISAGRVRPTGVSSQSAQNIAILGTNQLSYALAQQLLKMNLPTFTFVGFVEFAGCRFSPELRSASVIGEISDLRAIKARCFLGAIVIAEFYPYDKTLDLLKAAHELDLDVFSIAGYYDDLTTDSTIQYLGLFPVSVLYSRNPRAIARFVKRVIDLSVAALGVIVAALPMLLIALAIKCEGRGPIFYVAPRIGRWGKAFSCFKFRTMIPDADQIQQSLFEKNERDAILFKLEQDPRLTRIGGFLRKYSLDELPQLFNVLRGEMSMVGPRPPLPCEVASYSLDHLHRLTVMPGVTGLWQVQSRQDNSFTKYIALDMAYIKNWSLLLDFKILLRTVDVVLRGTGV